jgi:outer membrane protein OmpA-like peptidoglycan-associated protein
MKAYSNLNFETNKSKILESSFPSLNDLATYLNSNTNLKLALEGHTDNVGSETSNQTLSENRAKSVKDYLVSKGVAESRITHKGFGESKPIADNLTEEGKKQNRRVEFIIS